MEVLYENYFYLIYHP